MRTRLLVVVIALAVAACGSDGGDAADSTTTTDAPSTTTTATAGPTPTEPSTTLLDADDSGRSELEDGRHFGYWDSFEIGDTIAFGEFDLAYFLTGPEADQAATAHGDDPELDYYVVNENPKLRTLIAHGDTEVVVVDWDHCCGSIPSNVADLAVERRDTSGFWVTITNGIVTKIEEQYVP
jgi:hypothetical protein